MAVELIRNKERRGIELKFSEKPDEHTIEQMKDPSMGFRWHFKKKVWYTVETPERLAFARKLAGIEEPNEEKPAASVKKEGILSPSKEESSADQPLPNTYAAHYDKIHQVEILDKSDAEILNLQEAYFKEDDVLYRRTYSGDNLTIQDLANAGKTGKICPGWSITPKNFRDNVGILLYNQGIRTCSALLAALRSGKELDGLLTRKMEEKGIDVFSPFVESKPLKALPEKWTKRNFAQALCAGQIYPIETHGADIPYLVRNTVEHWSSSDSVRTDHTNPDGTAELCFYASKPLKLIFDIESNIQKVKERCSSRESGIQRYNSMLEAACIPVVPSMISPDKIYTVSELCMNEDTGLYESKDEHVQGYVLQDRLDPDSTVYKILNIEQMEIEPSALYKISNLFHQWKKEDDPRLIAVGNHVNYITGKALLEMTAEGQYCPMIGAPAPEFSTIESARDELQKFIDGHMFWGVNNANYKQSLTRLNHEYDRASHRSLDAMIHRASQATRSTIQPQRETFTKESR